MEDEFKLSTPGSNHMMKKRKSASSVPMKTDLRPIRVDDVDDRILNSRRHSLNSALLANLKRTSLEFIPESTTTDDLIKSILKQLPAETLAVIASTLLMDEEEDANSSTLNPGKLEAGAPAVVINDAKIFKIMEKLRAQVLPALQLQSDGGSVQPLNDVVRKRIDQIVKRAVVSNSPVASSNSRTTMEMTSSLASFENTFP